MYREGCSDLFPDFILGRHRIGGSLKSVCSDFEGIASLRGKVIGRLQFPFFCKIRPQGRRVSVYHSCHGKVVSLFIKAYILAGIEGKVCSYGQVEIPCKSDNGSEYVYLLQSGFSLIVYHLFQFE